MDDREKAEQLDRFKAAVDRKSEAAEAASHVQSPGGTPPEAIQGTQAPLEEDGRVQDVFSVRDKNSGHGKKTADKWNQ
jgi:hypothetical protein